MAQVSWQIWLLGVVSDVVKKMIEKLYTISVDEYMKSPETLKYLVKNRNRTEMINLKAALKRHATVPGPTLDLFWKLAGECELIRSTHEESNAPGKARRGFETNWDVERKLSRMRQVVNGMPWLQHPQPKE